MDWQSSEDTMPSAPVTEADARLLLGRPPATGAWRDGDPVGDRQFAMLGPLRTAVSGRRISPPLFESMELLGRESTLARIARLRAQL